ncbi:MAG: hypothetical protein O7D34_09015, partial [Ignavibacteria bacterium]|nr:hypothetical protein [Ignavibacteria bacterium]
RTWLPPPFSVGLFNRVRGTTLNNIVVVGVAGTIAHNNGISWYQYQQFFDPSGQPNLLGLSTREKMVMAVGYTGDRAIVIRGRK